MGDSYKKNDFFCKKPMYLPPSSDIETMKIRVMNEKLLEKVDSLEKMEKEFQEERKLPKDQYEWFNYNTKSIHFLYSLLHLLKF